MIVHTLKMCTYYYVLVNFDLRQIKDQTSLLPLGTSDMTIKSTS